MKGRFRIILSGLFACAFLLAHNAEAQKIKYKDLYYLLKAKKYNEAEPFLKQFLADEKNADHPNANYQMAIVYREKAEIADIFQEAEKVWIYSDSAVHFFTKAKEYVTDKEVKRNSEYYEEFQSRDFRTGKLSILAIDIHLVIDESIKEIRERQNTVAEVNDKLLEVITQYNTSRRYFINFKQGNRDINEMLLRANLSTIGALDHLVDTYDSFQTGFRQMREMLREIPKSGYSQQLDDQTINDFIADGESESHFLDDVVYIWNYEEWAKQVRSIILEDILPTKTRIVEHDNSLESLLRNAAKDSSVFGDKLQALDISEEAKLLRKYDADPLPLKLFELRKAELEYINAVLKNRQYREVSDYGLRIGLLEEEKVMVNKMDSIVREISRLDIDEQIRNYVDFVESRYNGFMGLDKFLKQKLESSGSYNTVIEGKLERLRERNSYVIFNDLRYYLDTSRVDEFYDTLSYRPRFTAESYSSGLINSVEGIHGYFIDVNPQRETSIFYEFDLDSLQMGDLPEVIGTNDKSGQVIYLLFVGDTVSLQLHSEDLSDNNLIDSTQMALRLDSLSGPAIDSTGVSDEIEELPEEQAGQSSEVESYTVHQAYLCKIYRIDGLAWKVPLNLRNEPISVRINDLGEVIIDEVDTDGSGQRKMLVLDNRDGSVKSD